VGIFSIRPSRRFHGPDSGTHTFYLKCFVQVFAHLRNAAARHLLLKKEWQVAAHNEVRRKVSADPGTEKRVQQRADPSACFMDGS
jgi:hypothetical protein